MNKVLVSLAVLLGLAPSAHAAAITAGQNITSASAGLFQPASAGGYTGNLANESGLAYNNTYLLDMAQFGVSQMSAQAFYSSMTFTSPTVSDGSASTASVRVISVSGASSATATIQITVTTNAFTTLPTLTFANCSIKMGQDFSKGSTKALTASNIATAITSCNPLIAASASAGIVYATATYGSYANSYAFTSDNSSMTVSAAKMSGGADNICITINGTALCNNRDWYVGATTNTAVLALGNAIAGAGLHLSTAASGILGVVYATATLNGTTYNYTLVSSSPTVISVSQAVFTNGVNSGFTLGSQLITSGSATTFTRALPVLYSTGSLAVGGLSNQTTYYAVPYSANSFYLAKYSTSAVAGLSADYVTVTSTNSGTSAHTYTVAPITISGTPSFKWQVSNDNSSWDDLSVSSVTVSSYSIPPAVTSWGFGTLGYRYIRLNVVAPTYGGLYLKVPVQLNR